MRFVNSIAFNFSEPSSRMPISLSLASLSSLTICKPAPTQKPKAAPAPVKLQVILAEEENPRPGVNPISWLLLTSLLILVIIPLIWGLQWQSPQVNPLNQNIDFGLHLSSEFATLLIGLTVYTAAFIAETVRGGIQSVNRGQWEAAKALGLKPLLVMRLVIFPQALPVIIPPLTNECLNLVKNSSLAIAIGYNDIYAISSTIANQTGKAVEMLIVVMATYLFFNLVILWL